MYGVTKLLPGEEHSRARTQVTLYHPLTPLWVQRCVSPDDMVSFLLLKVLEVLGESRGERDTQNYV
jgi:hypothetical protein